MAYTYEFGSIASGLQFTIVYDEVLKTFTVTVLKGAMNVNALYWSDGNSNTTLSGLYQLDSTKGDQNLADNTISAWNPTKADSSLNMNGATVVWDEGTSTTEKETWDGGLKISDTGLGKTPSESYIVAGSANP